jgi:hypothetical protein
MKKLLAIASLLVLTACAADNQQHVSTAYNMSWRCGTQACCNHMVPYSCGGSGSFQDQNTCLAWETLFLNGVGYPYNTVTACTGN